MPYNQVASVRNHYDLVSPYYRDLWGSHIHHGLWITGKETPAEAQELLIDELISRAGLQPGLRILDVGCGIGGSSIYLAKHLDAEVTGITISPVQAEMAQAAAEHEGVTADFRVMDAQNINFAPNERFDCIWSIEAISHFRNKSAFFSQASKLLVPGGVMAITDWFSKKDLSGDEAERFIEPIERGMLIELKTLGEYLENMKRFGNIAEQTVNLGPRVARTWDFCLNIIRDGALWDTAHNFGPEFVHFLDSFAAMKRGYEAEALEYQLIVCRRP